MGSPAAILKFCGHIDSLKHLKRTGWVKLDVEQPETVACHMYRLYTSSVIGIRSASGRSNIGYLQLWTDLIPVEIP